MARATTVWEITEDAAEPKRLPGGQIELEKTLETWIEKVPDLVEPGLKVLARQLWTDAGPLDLLCLDSDARLVIVELKRADAYRDAFAQALDYASCIALLSYGELEQLVNENRKARGDEGTLEDILRSLLDDAAEDWMPGDTDPRLVLVGTGADESLRRIVAYMTAKYGLPVNGVFFDVSVTSAGSTILVRSAVVADELAAQEGRRRGRGGITHEELLGLAEDRGVAAFVSPVIKAWHDGTERVARPEGGKYWSLATKVNGRIVAARLFPFNGSNYDKDIEKTAWLKLEISRLSADLKLDEAALKVSLSDHGLPIIDDCYVKLSDTEETDRVVAWIRKCYPAAPADQQSG